MKKLEMKLLNKIFIWVCVCCLPLGSRAQDTLRLAHEEFVSIVKNYHPMAYRYRLQNRVAQREVQEARGNFDPLLDASHGAKTLDGLDYYRETNLALNIPTWYGIEVTGKYNTIDGQRLNNSETEGGLYQFGVTVPLAQNLLYDKRRALLDQAKFARQMTEAEQELLTNRLLLEADNAYWTWVKQYEYYQLQSRTVAINRERLQLIRKTVEYGETAAIDTTEAQSQLQGFELQMEDAYLEWVKATQELSLYLWTENQQPYNLPLSVIPTQNLLMSPAYSNFALLINEVNTQPLQQHAAMQFIFQEQNILKSELKLNRQQLLPQLNFTYHLLNKESQRSKYFPLFEDNYQYGLKLGIPIFLRQERARFRITQTKLLQNKLESDMKRQELNTRISVYASEVQNYYRQSELAQQNISNFRRLLEAEETRFRNGESSLFLINTRETKLLEAEQKLLELRLKFLMSYNQLKWLNEGF
ncbi:MAG TPA: TolC family protein [Ferruginibacter sp.]|nr:TolC family protein [Ferruginibacter sp.]HRO05440.1 TolC family protein [Ferruginibacter sp.]HRP48917.1 TolC family protein [Ferruginibacter sp.]